MLVTTATDWRTARRPAGETLKTRFGRLSRRGEAPVRRDASNPLLAPDPSPSPSPRDQAFGFETIEGNVQRAAGEGPVGARGNFITNGRAVRLFTAGAQVQDREEDNDFKFTKGSG